MQKARTLLLYCGEAVYPREWLDRRIEGIAKELKSLPMDILCTGTLLEEADAVSLVARGLPSRPDLIVCVFVSWHITGTVMQVLREYQDVPVLVLSASGLTDETGKLHAPAAPAGITALLPYLRELGILHKSLFQKPGEPLPLADIAAFANVARTRRVFRHSRIGLIGYADMGLYSCTYDRSVVSAQLGIDVEDYFSYEIGQQMASVPEERIDETLSWIREKVTFENSVPEQTLEKAARLYCAMKDKAAVRNLAGISIKCVHGVTKHMGINPCMAQSLLASPDLSVICECDAYGLITNVLLSQLTGQDATFLEHYEFYEDAILIGTCGYLPFGLAEEPLTVRGANLGDYFVGLGNTSRMRPGLMTYARLYRDANGFAMFVGKGTAQSPQKWTELGWQEPSPDFPSVLLKLEMPVYEYVDKVPGQHIILTHGDWTADLAEWCRLAGVRLVQ